MQVKNFVSFNAKLSRFDRVTSTKTSKISFRLSVATKWQAREHLLKNKVMQVVT